MTLDIKTLLKNLLEKQMSIQHFTAKTDVFSTNVIPNRIKDKIKAEFGDQYLLDANYVVFFRGNIDKEGMKKLFNLTNKAFGEDANRLTEGDFKKISFAVEEEPAEEPEKVEEPNVSDDAEGDEKEVETVDTTTSSDDSGDDKDSAEIDDEVDEIVNEGEPTKLDEDVEVDSSTDAYVFLKITTK